MGEQVAAATLEPGVLHAYGAALRRDLEALRELLLRPGFGIGPATLGAELELSLIDSQGAPAPHNLEVLAAADDDHLTVELDRFNLEYNADPFPLAGRPFATLADQLTGALEVIARAGAGHGARPIAVGLLPTIDLAAVGKDGMTDLPRYHALDTALRRYRADVPFRIRIDGDEPLEIESAHVTVEGANTSLQIHLRVEPARYADTFNAAQLATPIALAAAGNSPFFLGHALWEETRIALFKQAVDHRLGGGSELRPARVCFGHGWVRRGIHELFAEAVYLHRPLLATGGDRSDPVAEVSAGGVPSLEAMRLHHGTVWRWNRPVYDRAGGGHLRIELRALPAGPSVIDMAANAAFLLGLTLALRERIDPLIAALPFAYAEHNFYRAAQRGLEADLLWPQETAPSPRPRRASGLVRELLPAARAALVGAGVDSDEVDLHLAVIERRAASGQTGARWQRQAVRSLDRTEPRPRALARMVETYLAHSQANLPVHEWPLER